MNFATKRWPVPGKLRGKQNSCRFGVRGSAYAIGDSVYRCAPEQSSWPGAWPKKGRSLTLAMPQAAESLLHFVFCCFPPASPAVGSGAGKQKTARKGRSKSLIFLRKIGAGEGIRTLDPDLGKVVLYH